ncbi:hypothetical protein AXG93_1855s1040 [Marchantia polymorpha subsp. ruderalis]|uniref:Uncharacterized protein n=1 Tax=Marchantia polymorpha subsp. ruderalis TaxID=1480154 RepID=A0A176VN30_MARPO|nr:hypothetical protein AXG93_1855s1040 [Marchantia polymorpha subsp. ruderalis]
MQIREEPDGAKPEELITTGGVVAPLEDGQPSKSDFKSSSDKVHSMAKSTSCLKYRKFKVEGRKDVDE